MRRCKNGEVGTKTLQDCNLERGDVSNQHLVATNKEAAGVEEEFSKVEKKGGFAGCPLRREAGMFAGRANPEMEVTPTSKHRRRFQNLGRRSPGGEGGATAGGQHL